MKSKKHSCKNNVCSQCGVMWQTGAVGLWKCDLGLPSHHLITKVVTTTTVQELSNSTSYCRFYMSQLVAMCLCACPLVSPCHTYDAVIRAQSQKWTLCVAGSLAAVSPALLLGTPLAASRRKQQHFL
jgi:hypothetical protein